MSPIAIALTGAVGVGAAVPAMRWVNSNRWRHEVDEPGRSHLPAWVAVPVLAIAGAVVGATLMTGEWWPAGVAAGVLLVGMLMASVTDLAVFRIPEPLVLALQGVVVVTLLVGTLVTADFEALGRALACGVAVWVTMFLYALLTGGMGFGDVQLFGAAALALGWVAWQASIAVVVAGLVVGGVWAIVLWLRGQRGGSFAFAPSIGVAFVITVAAIPSLVAGS
ncbi:MAG: prepilin peptidase [Dermatophilaceae bacterium]